MRTLGWLGALLALLAAGAAAPPAAARTQVTELTGYEVTCSFVQGREWSSGPVFHIRDEVDRTRSIATNVETGEPDPRLVGANTIILNLNLNTETGRGTFFGSTVLQPDAVDGTWETTYTGTIRDGVVNIRATGRGTGDLGGLKLKVELQSIDLADAPELCEPDQEPLAASTYSAWITDPGRP